MRERKIVKTTVGELIVAVTDEVVPLARDSSELYRVASCIINHVLARHRPRVHKWSRGKYPSYLAKALH
jgi:hypothetical protein